MLGGMGNREILASAVEGRVQVEIVSFSGGNKARKVDAMWRVVFIAFLIAHGAIHAAIWALPKPEGQTAPFDPAHSWVIGEQRVVAMVLALAATFLLVAAGSFLWAQVPLWRLLAASGLIVSLGLMILYFNPWFLPIQVMNASLVVGIVWSGWPADSMVGI
jgi:hypothetical protein